MIIDVSKELKDVMQIGRVGENIVTEIQFDFSKWVEAYGAGGDFYLTARQPQSDVSYPIVVTVDENIATWTITNSDLLITGFGKVEAWYRIGDAVKASAIFDTWIGESLDGSGEVPSPYESWLQEVEQLKEDAEAARDEAADSADDAEDQANAARGYAEAVQEAVINALEHNLLFLDDNNDGNIRIEILQGVNNG